MLMAIALNRRHFKSFPLFNQARAYPRMIKRRIAEAINARP